LSAFHRSVAPNDDLSLQLINGRGIVFLFLTASLIGLCSSILGEKEIGRLSLGYSVITYLHVGLMQQEDK
jgi:hypothetical protein